MRFHRWKQRFIVNNLWFSMKLRFLDTMGRPTSITRSKICLRPFSFCCSTSLWLLSKTGHRVMVTQEKAKTRCIDFSGPSFKTNGKPLTAINHGLQAPCNIPLSSYSFLVFASQVLSPMFFSPTVSDLALKISSNTRHREAYGMSSNYPGQVNPHLHHLVSYGFRWDIP